jgi:hypothetical protein
MTDDPTMPGDFVFATFKPRRTDDLRPDSAAFVGHRGLFRRIYRIDDGGEYDGEWAMEPPAEWRSKMSGWVPSGDLGHAAIGHWAPLPEGLTLADSTPSCTQVLTPAHVLLFGPNISIDYGANPPKVTLNGAEPDAAAKAFWNAVHAVVGRAPLFPESAPPDPWENAGGSNDRTD